MFVKSFMTFNLFSWCFITALPLFEHYPVLQTRIPYVQLAQLPTPITRCCAMQQDLHCPAIFIKRDDATGSCGLYGGNKVRKLEFLLGDALQRGARKIITFGCVGTNHGLATACYSKKLGLDCLLMLKHQPNSPIVRQNLLLDHYFKAEIAVYNNDAERMEALNLFLETDADSYFFPTGGSVPLGVLGYVNAALEFKKQIEDAVMPEPDYIYMPIGSCGTVAGLLLGFRLVGIKSKIVAVAVEPEKKEYALEECTKKLFYETNELLHGYDGTIPLFEFPDEQLIISKDFCGIEYGAWLPSVKCAADYFQETENIVLEGTYSAKAVAALMHDIKNKVRKKDEVMLLWNTYCGLDFSSLIDTIDYKELNPAVHGYFEEVL